MKKINEIIVDISFFLLRTYRKTLKITGLSFFINKLDPLFNLYVIPARIHVVIKRIFLEGHSFSYAVDVLTKGYLKKRKGNCMQCGGCCYNCISLVEKDGKKVCGVYPRRDWCNVYFPVSKHELDYVTKLYNCNCGFYFD